MNEECYVYSFFTSSIKPISFGKALAYIVLTLKSERHSIKCILTQPRSFIIATEKGWIQIFVCNIFKLNCLKIVNDNTYDIRVENRYI